jgi:BirA family transcriptional regulator, biotin operon repressor / biotin---[acetyl-CoA-carboxylase] ligase
MLKTLFTGKNAFWLEETTSTNLSLYEMLSMNRLPEGSAVLAQYQTKGKGQFGTQWESERGKNILASYVFYPGFLEPRDLFLLNKTIALGVYDYVKSVVKKNVTVKWPNDIYVGDKKIAGILIENSITFSDINYSIAGIGLNVNQTAFGAFLVPATSFKLITKKSTELEKCFHALSTYLETRYLMLKEKKVEEINSDYKEAMYRFGKLFPFRRGKATFRARIVDVMGDGKLVLRHENGKWESFRFKEIAFVTE